MAAKGATTRNSLVGQHLRLISPSRLSRIRSLHRSPGEPGQGELRPRQTAQRRRSWCTSVPLVASSAGSRRAAATQADTTLRFFVNNVLRVTKTDASYASGRPGLTIFIGTGGTVGQVQLDNFSAGSFYRDGYRELALS